MDNVQIESNLSLFRQNLHMKHVRYTNAFLRMATNVPFMGRVGAWGILVIRVES